MLKTRVYLTRVHPPFVAEAEGYRSNSNELEMLEVCRKILKYALCGGLWLCMRERRWEYFSFDIPSSRPRSIFSRNAATNEIWIKVSGTAYLAPPPPPPTSSLLGIARRESSRWGLDSLATFYNAVSLNMYRFAPRARSPNSSRPPPAYPASDDITASAITRNICFKDYAQPNTPLHLYYFIHIPLPTRWTISGETTILNIFIKKIN